MGGLGRPAAPTDGGSMTATHEAVPADRGAVAPRRSRWPLLVQPVTLIVYVVAVVGIYLGVTVVAIVWTPILGGELVTFLALLLCGGLCVEATRRLGAPTGISRDLLSAWWLPVALLLPPAYALLVPIPLYVLLQLRVSRAPLFRRIFTMAAIGLGGAAASVVFHWQIPEPLRDVGRVIDPRAGILLAIGCAVLFTVVNTALVALAAHTAAPECKWREVLWNRESLILDVVEMCLGVLVTIACALNPGLLLLTLPPVMLLQRSLLHQQLQAAARTDAKTGLLNATAWQRAADTEISRALRSGEPLALLLVDIDHFKRVNDSHGHLVGDQVLVGVANTLCNQLRDYDLVGRFGGEEFVVLVPGADTLEACRVAERLRSRVRRLAIPVGDATAGVTISVGVALLRTHGRDLLDLLAAADLALYRAKESGRDRICLPAARATAAAGGPAQPPLRLPR
jgi:diguanylate cyclase (GGDEF)-like protein